MTKQLLSELFDFLDLNTQFQKSSAEHSYQLALVAWYLITKHKLPLDLTLVIKYSLIHDLTKEDAKKELEIKFPDFRDVHHLINSHSKKAYEESKFVYALDKLIPLLHDHKNNNGKITSDTDGLKFESEVVERYFQELVRE